MEAIDTFEVGKYKVEIHVDEDPIDPRTDCDNDDVMVCFHKRYCLGDKHNYKMDDFNSWDELEAQIIKDHDPVVIKPIYMYDHSGLTIATTPFSCKWDSGQIGYIFISKKEAYKSHMVKRITKKIKETCEKNIESSVNVYDEYLSGESYGYIIKDETDEEVESCWGFFGLDYVKKEAKTIAEYLVNQPPKENPNQMKLALENT